MSHRHAVQGRERLAPLHRLLLVVLLVLGGMSAAQASVANAPGADLQVSLISYGPGETYWERFGHDAIEVRDSASGEAVDFNYGVFDFNESNFFLNFARGRMHYLMDAEFSAPEQASYMQDGRSVTSQRLALSPVQASALRDFLLWNLQPANAGYNYDYYADNCTTRVRDALDKVIGGVLKKQLAARPGGMTYRQQTARLMSAQPWLMLVLDLGLGPYADQPLNAWQESFLPMQPLVQSEQLMSPNRLDVPPATPPDLRLPLASAGLLLAFALLLARLWWPLGFSILNTLYLIAAGLVGVILLALWTLTTHHSAWANANLLLFNPLAWLLLPAVWRARRGITPSRLADGLLMLQLLALLTALSMHLLPGVVQQNQPWLLFALPYWLAIAWSLRQATSPR
jgi:opacity protein-like surface antigen